MRPWPRQWHTFWLSKPFGLDIADLDIAGNVRCFVMWRKGSFISSCDAIQRTSLLVENRNRSLRCFLQAKSISAEGRERLAMETIPRCDETIDLCALQNSVANFKHNQEQNATWDGMQAVTLDRSCQNFRRRLLINSGDCAPAVASRALELGLWAALRGWAWPLMFFAWLISGRPQPAFFLLAVAVEVNALAQEERYTAIHSDP